MSEKTPKVSVIIRCYNNQDTVTKAVESVLSQDFPKADYEILAIDDDSKDGSREQLKFFADKVRLHLESHRGNIGTAHFALSKARGRYVLFVDGDDYAEPGMVRGLSEALDRSPNAAFACCDYNEIFPDGKRQVVPISGKVFRLIACNCMFRREPAQREGFWEKGLLLPEYRLAIRLLARHPAAYVAKPLYNYCRRDASMTRQNGFWDRAMGELKDRYGALAPNGNLEELTFADCAKQTSEEPVWRKS